MKLIRMSVIIVMILMTPWPLLSSERAQFWNLGFSDNAQYFSFTQFWIDSRNAQASSELYVVDTTRNSFVSGGKGSYKSSSALSPGNNGRNASLHLFREKIALFRQYNINNLEQGRLIYIYINGNAAGSTASFRDFSTNNLYNVTLQQNSNNRGAAFSMAVKVEYADGSIRRFNVGLPNFYRNNVYFYRLSQVIIAPDERTLIFVIEQKLDFKDSNRTRYMVETAVLPKK